MSAAIGFDTSGAVTPIAVPDDWSARHESRFAAMWLTYLLSRFGEWCRVSDVWEPADAYQRAVLRQRAHEVVQAAKRLGLAVESDRLRGYRVTGHLGLPAYLHLHERAADRTEGEADGQMSLGGEEE